MKQLLSCSAGHEWEWSDDDPDRSRSVHCPICGRAADTLMPPSRGYLASGSAGVAASDLTRTGRPTSAPRGGGDWPAVPGYEIRAELGRGGMGVVYHAWQSSLRRDVAVKMLLNGSRERFRLEAEAIARLQHPNIVQIYEVGEVERGPFYSQEYIAGGSLAARLNGTPWPAQQAADMVAVLAEAVAFTHDRQIVHRDLKPANILLGEGDTPKITDFGLAKELDRDSGQTETGDIIGSPSYMAPEQASGVTRHITGAVDIYALGAILYELLAGHPPFRGSTALDTVFQVLSNEPIPLRRLQPRLPPDLETICAKCLEKSPQARYVNAHELAADLRRFLVGEPIHARPVPAWVRAGKWARRRPGLATAIGVAALSTVALIVGGWTYSARLAAALQQAGIEKQQREATLVQAQNVVDQLLSGFSEQRLARLPHSESLRRELLTSALQLCADLQQQNPDEPDLQWQTGRAQRQAADLQTILGQPREAQETYARSIATLELLVARYPHPRYERELAGAYQNRGVFAAHEGMPEEAELDYRRALDIFNRLKRDQDIDRQLARTWGNLGVALLADSRISEAAEVLGKSNILLQRLAEGSTDPVMQQALALSFNNLGTLRQETGELIEAAESFDRAHDLFEHLADQQPDNADYRFGLATAAANLGTVRSQLPDAAGAMELMQQALDVCERLARDFPSVEEYRFQQAQALDNEAARLAREGQMEEAAKRLLQAQRVYEELIAQNGRTAEFRICFAQNLRQQGVIASASGNFAEADEKLSRALKLQAALGDEAPRRASHQRDLAASYESAAELFLAKKDLSKARYYLELAVQHQMQAAQLAPKNPQLAKPLRRQYATLAGTLLELGELDQATNYAERIAQLAPADSSALMEAARLFAHCIPLADRFKSVSRPALKDDCGRRAVELLNAAITSGQLQSAEVTADDDFSSLRDREDFQALVVPAANKAIE